MILRWWEKMLGGIHSGRIDRSRRPDGQRYTPRLESLEDRVVPSAAVLDPTFGVGGKVTTSFVPGNFAQATAVAIQTDNSIIAAGRSFSDATGFDFALAKYLDNGSLDTSFGTLGRVTTDFFGGNDQVQAVALLPGGKILVAGTAFNGGNDFALAQYNANGTLDTTFGTLGLVTTDFGTGSDDQAFAMVIRPSGSSYVIVVAGYSSNLTNGNDFALAQYTSTGSLDGSFGAGGLVTTPFVGSGDSEIQALALQADGKLVAVGFAHPGASYDFAAARYSPSGVLDPTFGGGGTVTTDFTGSDDLAFAVAIKSGGQIVLGGKSTTTDTDFALVQYDSFGSLDGTFDSDGRVTTFLAGIDDEIHSLAVQSGDKILAGGFTSNGTNYDFALARYNPNGSLDAGTSNDNFTSSGTLTTDFSGGSDQAYSIQSNGKILAVGNTASVGGTDFALARYVTTPVNTAKPIGILLLDKTGKGALEASGNAVVRVTGGGDIVVNDTDAKAVILSGKAAIFADDLDLAGSSGPVTSGRASVNATVNESDGQVADPLLSIAAPTTVGLTFRGAVRISEKTITTLSPGLYDSIDISGQAVVTLNPGLYYVRSGGLRVSGQAKLSGTGVTIYFAPISGNDCSSRNGLNISGQAVVTLTARSTLDVGPACGAIAGIAVFEDRASRATLSIAGNGQLNVTGVVYAASATIDIDGNGKLSIKGDVTKRLSGELIADDLEVDGNGQVSVDVSAN